MKNLTNHSGHSGEYVVYFKGNGRRYTNKEYFSVESEARDFAKNFNNGCGAVVVKVD